MGRPVGAEDGSRVGSGVGSALGWPEGAPEGSAEGWLVGRSGYCAAATRNSARKQAAAGALTRTSPLPSPTLTGRSVQRVEFAINSTRMEEPRVVLVKATDEYVRL